MNAPNAGNNYNMRGQNTGRPAPQGRGNIPPRGAMSAQRQVPYRGQAPVRQGQAPVRQGQAPVRQGQAPAHRQAPASPGQNTARRTGAQRRGSSRRSNSGRSGGSGGVKALLIFLAIVALVVVAVFVINSLKSGEEDDPEKVVDLTGQATSVPETAEQTGPETESETEPETEAPFVPTVPEFKSDLSAYEAYMNPTGEERDAYLLLVNKQHPVGSDYVPADLVVLPQKYCVYPDESNKQMVSTAAKAMEAMLTEAYANGFDDIKITLPYRSYATENWLYTKYINEELTAHPGWSREQAIELVETYKAPPGKGEHQSGLCADMHNLYKRANYKLDDFQHEAAYPWFRENCWKFGFILRFPPDKVDITGYKFESWHYRFVGRYHAEQIYRQGLCLEEYLEQIGK